MSARKPGRLCIGTPEEEVGRFMSCASEFDSHGRALTVPLTEITMEFALAHPRQIRSFSYDIASHVLLAHHLDGDVTVCSDVPESMYEALTHTLAPEELFVRYVRPQFDCETISSPHSQVQ